MALRLSRTHWRIWLTHGYLSEGDAGWTRRSPTAVEETIPRGPAMRKMPLAWKHDRVVTWPQR